MDECPVYTYQDNMHYVLLNSRSELSLMIWNHFLSFSKFINFFIPIEFFANMYFFFSYAIREKKQDYKQAFNIEYNTEKKRNKNQNICAIQLI